MPIEEPELSRPPTAVTAPASDTSHLLLVEDSDTQAMRLRLHLESQGWRVSRAASGAEARTLLDAPDGAADNPFDLILMDYHLPDVRGDELIREMRESDGAARSLPILLLTASEERDTELRGLRSGADDFVPKAASIDVLITRLDALLRKSRAHAELSDLYEREHRVAHVLQEALLSAAPPDAFRGLTVRMVYEPAWDEAQIGGDFYDMLSLGRDTAALMVGDVAGKGLKAATFTAEVKYALRAFLYEDADPGRALTRLNEFLVQHAERNPWATTALVALCLAVYDTATGQFRLAAAGAEPPLLLRRDSATNIVTDEEVAVSSGMLLGIIGDVPYETLAVTLHPGDSLLFFTDGITEARQRGGDMLGYDGVARVAKHALQTHQGDTEALIETLVGEAKRVSGGRLLDDACVIAAQRC